MRIPGLRTAGRIANALEARLLGSGVILGYHRVADEAFDPWGMCVSPANFAEHLEVIRDLGTVISMRELVAALVAGHPIRRAIAISFDDGYVDNAEVAMPMLARMGMPATFFIATGFHGREFWWDTLERVVALAPELPPVIRASSAGETFEWDAGSSAATPQERVPLLSTIHSGLMRLTGRERDGVIAQIASQVEGAPAPDLGRFAMSVAEVQRLARRPSVEIGAHSVHHPGLAMLSAEAQATELRECKEALASSLGSPPAGFSYPHGSWSEVTTRLAREADYTYACTTQRSGVHWRCDPFLLPRIFPGNYPGDRLDRELVAVLGRRSSNK